MPICLALACTDNSGESRPSDKGGGGGGGGHSDPEIRWGEQPPKNFFGPFGLQFGLKIRGGGRAPRAPPLDPPLDKLAQFC